MSHLSSVIKIIQQRLHHVDWIITEHIFNNESVFNLPKLQKLLPAKKILEVTEKHILF